MWILSMTRSGVIFPNLANRSPTMPITRWSEKFYESTRGRIVALLRRSGSTVDKIADALGLTDNAVRAHLATLERDGIVEQRVLKTGKVGKPAYTYQLSSEAEPLFSRAYLPVLRQLLDVLAERMRPDELDRIMRSVGRRLAQRRGIAPGGDSLDERVTAAAGILEQLGGVTEVERHPDGALVIRGFSCPLGAAVHGHPQLCSAVETLLSEVTGASVRECCDRSSDRARCCFEVSPPRVADASGDPG
jgi:predicted ArsR family transcriptional regulator